MLAGVFVIGAMVTNVAASSIYDDDIPFTGTVKTYWQNTLTEARYRQTLNCNNTWKVNMTYTEEAGGKGVTDFWIEIESNGKNVSDTYSQSVADGEIYHIADSGAAEKYVCLAMENNNYSSNSYKIKGVWDEETGIVYK